MIKYFQEFELTPRLYELLIQYNLKSMLARNLADNTLYSLTPMAMESLTKLEETMAKQIAEQQESVEEAMAEWAAEKLQMLDLHNLTISCQEPVYQVSVSGEKTRQIIKESVMEEERLIQLVLEDLPEAFWMVHSESPVFSPTGRKLLAQAQYYNYLLKLM